MLCSAAWARDLYIDYQRFVGSFLAQRAPPAEVLLLCSLCSRPVIHRLLLVSHPDFTAMHLPLKRLSAFRQLPCNRCTQREMELTALLTWLIEVNPLVHLGTNPDITSVISPSTGTDAPTIATASRPQWFSDSQEDLLGTRTLNSVTRSSRRPIGRCAPHK